MSAHNQAAWIKGAKAHPFVVDDAPLWPVNAHEVRIKVSSAAVNPVDWKIQSLGIFLQEYPAIVGTDVAGTIEAVGEGVVGLEKGDRVLAYAASLGLNGKPEYAGFQHYVLAIDSLVTKLPANVSFDEGSVLPLSLATAAHGLFDPAFLGLDRPSASPNPANKHKTVLVWGGASSVGASAVQLIVRAGYTVVATASTHNHEFVRSIGATTVIDYQDADVVAKLRAAVHGEWSGAYDAISAQGSVQKAAEVIGSGKIVTTLPPPNDLPAGIEANRVFAGLLATSHKQLGYWLFREYLPSALADGNIKPVPPPLIVHGGLSHVQEGVDLQKKGVSGKKVVVRVDE